MIEEIQNEQDAAKRLQAFFGDRLYERTRYIGHLYRGPIYLLDRYRWTTCA
jgi:hypothetical protein